MMETGRSAPTPDTDSPSPNPLPQLTLSSSIFDPIQDEEMEVESTAPEPDLLVDNPEIEDIGYTVEIGAEEVPPEPEPIVPTVDHTSLKIPPGIIISNVGFVEDENSVPPVSGSRLRAQKRKRYISRFLENERFTDVSMGTLIVGLPDAPDVDYSEEFGVGVDIYPEDNALEKLTLDPTPQNTLANRLGQYMHFNKPLPKSCENAEWLATPRLDGGILSKTPKSQYYPRKNMSTISQPKFVSYVTCGSLSDSDEPDEVDVQLSDLEDPEYILEGIEYKDLLSSCRDLGNIIFGNGFDQAPKGTRDQDPDGNIYPFCVEPPRTKMFDERREMIGARYTEILESFENESLVESEHWIEPLRQTDTKQYNRNKLLKKLSSDIPKKFEKIAGQRVQKMIAWFEDENMNDPSSPPELGKSKLQEEEQIEIEVEPFLGYQDHAEPQFSQAVNPPPFFGKTATPRKSPPTSARPNQRKTYLVQRVNSTDPQNVQPVQTDSGNVEDDLFDYPVFEEVSYDEGNKQPAFKVEKVRKPIPKPVGDTIYGRPGVPYSHIIYLALKNSIKGFLPVNELYAFFLDHFPYFHSAPLGWKNSIRHNLSLNRSFKKYVHRSEDLVAGKKGYLWTLCDNPERMARMENDLNKIFLKHPEMLQDTMACPENLEILLRGELKRDYSTMYKDEEEEAPPPPRPHPKPKAPMKKLAFIHGFKSFEDSPMFQGTLTQLRKFLNHQQDNLINPVLTDLSALGFTSPSEIMKSAMLDMYNDPPPLPNILSRRGVHSSGILKRN